MAASGLILSPTPVEDFNSSAFRHNSGPFSLQQKPIQASATTLGQGSSMVPLEVSKSDTIASIKIRIQAHKKFHVGLQGRVYGGQDLTQNDSLLQDYGVSHGDVSQVVLLLSDLVSLTVRTVNGKSFVYKVWQTDTVTDLKEFISGKEGAFPVGLRVAITLKGEYLEDSAVIDELSLRGESHLYLHVHSLNLCTKFLGRTEIELVVTSFDDVPCPDVVASKNGLHASSDEGSDFQKVSYWDSKVGREEQHLQQFRHGLQSAGRYSSCQLSKYPIGFELSHTLRDLVEHVKMGLHAGQAPKLTPEGSGGVYLMKEECGLQNIAVFKPMDEEPMAVNNPRGFSVANYGEGLKKGTRSGEGAIREVAAYILDHPAIGPKDRTRADVAKRDMEGFSGVPPTTMVKCYHEAFHYLSDDHKLCKAKIGSLQQFVHALSSCEDMGSSMFPVEEVHKITVLDMRLANTDRNGGNILVCKGKDGVLKLVPIDHGYCLPDKFEECSFEWLYWPQAQQPYGPSMLEYIESLDAEGDIALLQQCGWSLRPQLARIVRISTMLLKKGAAAGLTPFQIGLIMSRGESPDIKSPIELILEEAEAMHPTNAKELDFLNVVAGLLDEYIMIVKCQ